MSINLTLNPNSAFCIAPWVNLHINQFNQVKPCCGGQGQFKSIESYVDSIDPGLNTLKQELINGITPDFCNGCVEKAWYSEFLNQDIIIQDINSFLIKSIDARWGVTCQLSCMYCDTGSSSTWSQLKSKTIPIHSTRIYKNNIDKIFELIAHNQNQITRVSMLGGEPLLLKENLKLLDNINDNTSIEIFTNLNLDIEDNEIYQRLIVRDNVNWYVSMENINQRFEFVRRGSNWDQQIKNLQLLDSSSKRPINLHSQYCVYSALHLLELYEFADKFKNVIINLTSGVTHPEELNFFLFPKKLKLQALEHIGQCIVKYPNDFNLTNIQQMLKSALYTIRPGIVEDCITWHQEMENKYFNNRFDFLELWPEYLAK